MQKKPVFYFVLYLYFEKMILAALQKMASKCRKFTANQFDKTRCQQCFKPKESHSADALESNRVCVQLFGILAFFCLFGVGIKSAMCLALWLFGCLSFALRVCNIRPLVTRAVKSLALDGRSSRQQQVLLLPYNNLRVLHNFFFLHFLSLCIFESIFYIYQKEEIQNLYV